MSTNIDEQPDEGGGFDSLETTDIVRRCTELIVRYTHFADLGDLRRVPELFTAEGIWATPAEEHKGQSALCERFQRMADDAHAMQWVTRHVCSNVLIEVLSAVEATATVYLTLYMRVGASDGTAANLAPAKIGQYHDRMVRTTDGWRFAERRCSHAFV